ncbi:unnamed protein product [Merluccius merluccius]
MELGKAKLMKTGLNALHQAIHPVHGVAWTDGKQVCLTSLLHDAGGGGGGGEVRFGDANVIGQFEHVLGLSWGPACRPGAPALLAVQHKKHVTVWQLQLSALEHNKLLCTQTCELSEPWPLLPQGCVWHPALDVLAVLTKRDASVLFSVRADNRRVKADVRPEPGAVRCACWTKDGARLVVAVGGALHSFVWDDGRKSLLPCAFCPVFDVGGRVCAVEATAGSQVAVATELPLDKLCGLNAGGGGGGGGGAAVFETPAPNDPPSPHAGHRESPAAAASDGAAADSSRRSFLETACSSLASSGPVDLTHLLARHRRSDPSPLLHLQRRDAAAATAAGAGQDSSHLILVTYERKVTTSRKVSIPGILVPDVVAFDPRGATVAVASNACSMVLVYCVTASSAVPNVQQISLQKSERPKGACFLSDRLLLLMVGRQKSCADAAFLPSSSASNTDKYALRIVVKDLVHGAGDGDPAPSCASPSASPSAFFPRAESPARLHQERIRRHSEHAPRDERLGQGIKDLVLPGGGAVGAAAAAAGGPRSPGGSRRRLVEEVAVCFSATSSCSSMENFDSGRAHAPATPTGPAGAASPRSSDASDNKPPPSSEAAPPPPPRSPAPPSRPPAWDKGVAAAARERGLEQLVENMERLFARFADVQQCMAEIRDYAQNGKKAVAAAVATPYPSALEPPYVNITCQRQLSENVFIDERRPVLLCEGKLRLSALHDLFNLTIVEMMSGPLWIVLVADAGGFVPLTFKPRDELMVRNGRRKSPFLSPGSPETPSPPAPIPGPSSPGPPGPAPMASSPGPPGTLALAPVPRPSSPSPSPTPIPTPTQTANPAPMDAST